MILVDYENVEIRKEENLILREVSFQQEAGEFLYIIGSVGSGKSSLLKTIYCEIPIEMGSAHVLNFDILNIKRQQIPFLRRKVGIVFQDFQLLTDRSVQKNLQFVLKATGWKDNSSIEARIEEVLENVGMGNKGYKFPHELSGGEQQRIVIARALLNSPQLILADEPTGNLDPETGGQIVKLLHEIGESGTAVIMTTHNYHWVQDFPAKVMKCEENRLIDS
ncbi:MAG: ATP-binding cassette domain-containing protein [Dysgonamonadaceae bacterium]|jgi:cell division transport system ATP-binding protein|nr:ATP-binding cassette domain-containing protein [Dysgonamonadaceae bacterium]